MGSNHFGKLLPHWKVTGLSHDAPVVAPVVEVAKSAPAPVVKPVIVQEPAPEPVISSDDE